MDIYSENFSIKIDAKSNANVEHMYLYSVHRRRRTYTRLITLHRGAHSISIQFCIFASIDYGDERANSNETNCDDENVTREREGVDGGGETCFEHLNINYLMN